MKSIFPVGLLLACLLSVLNVGTVTAATATDKPVAASQERPVKKVVAVKKPVTPKKAAPQKKRPPIASKSKSASEVVRTTDLPSTNVDLSLPPEMVRQLQPLGSVPLVKRTPLLPPLFGEKPKEDGKFQLNGRLISNELQLQMRNEDHREIEGAALEELAKVCEKRFGHKLNVQVALEPELIGGVRVVVGDEVLDTSVKARLERMKSALLA